MSIFKITRKMLAIGILAAGLLIVLLAVGAVKVTQWTNGHTIVWQSPVRLPWVVSAKNDETARLQSTDEKLNWVIKEVQAQKEWMQDVDATLPDEAKSKD